MPRRCLPGALGAGLLVVAPAPDALEERLPFGGAERKAASAGVLGVTYRDGPADAGYFNALITGVAVAGLAPLDVGGYMDLRSGHRGSFASAPIRSTDSSGPRACLTRFVQARLKRSSSSPDSR